MMNNNQTEMTYRIIANSYAINCKGRTAPNAVNGPFLGTTIGSSQRPSAKFGSSVMMMSSAPLALTLKMVQG